MPGGGLAMRSKVAFTSSEVNSAPSWNCTPLRRMEGVGLAVLGDLPAMREIGDDGLAAVARVAPDQVVEHAALAAQAVDRAGLMHVEMRRARGDGVSQHAARLRVGLRRLELELRAVELVGHALRQGEPCACRRRLPRRRRPTPLTNSRRFTRERSGRVVFIALPPIWPFPDRALCALMAWPSSSRPKANTTKFRESSR